MYPSCIYDGDSSYKKYGTHSALNMFDEFSMIDPGPMAEYVGFTEEEVASLCENIRWTEKK